MSKASFLFSVVAVLATGCFQPVGLGGTTGSSTGGTTGGGCMCASGSHCSPDPQIGPACVADGCGALNEQQCRADPSCTVVVKPNDGFDHCAALSCDRVLCDAQCQIWLDVEGCAQCACPGEGCSTDADCGSDAFCNLPICDGPDGPCPAYGTCEPRNPPPASCSSDSDCSAGEHCLPDSSGTCNCPSDAPGCTCAVVSTCQPGCLSDADCSQGEVCQNSALTGPGACVATGCTTDADCGSGQFCDIADCDIWGPCPAQGVCEDLGDGGPAAGCSADLDCGPGAHCVQPECFRDPCPGYCEADAQDAGPGGCFADADCGSNERCVRQACGDMPCCDQIPPGTQPPCISDTTPGQCVAVSPSTCSVDADCPTGEACFLCMGANCNPGLCFPAPSYPCGNTTCSAGQACVEYGGAQNTPVCVDAPSACAPPGGRASCDCIGQQLCGTSDPAASTDCSGAIPYVSCGYP